MLRNMYIDFTLVRTQRTDKHKKYSVLLHHMRDIVTMASFQATIGYGDAAKAGAVEAGGLFGVTHPEGDVVKAKVLPALGNSQ